MIDVSLNGNNIIYIVAGVGGVVFTSIGGVLLRCVLNRRRKNQRIQDFEKEIKKSTEKVIQETIAKTNRDLQTIREEDLRPVVTVKEVEPV